MIQSAQIEKLTDEHVPPEHRGWVNTAVLLPMNRVLDLIRNLLNRGVSLRTHINAQVIERKFTAPSGSDWTNDKLDTPLNLSGPVLGVQVLACYTTDGAGHDTGPVGALPSPTWREAVVERRRVLRLVFQSGLTPGTAYRLVLVAWGQ